MYSRIECINCGKSNLENVKRCTCGAIQHNKKKPEFFSEMARCYVFNCNAKADERRGENIWMCAKHSEDWILKTQPDSLEAKVILGARKIESEAKAAGMTNREYFEKINPRGYEMVQKMMKVGG
jgi:hypothetical protein